MVARTEACKAPRGERTNTSAASSIFSPFRRAPPPVTSRRTSDLDFPSSSRMNKSITAKWVGWIVPGFGGVGWDGMEWNGMGWDGVGWDGTQWEEALPASDALRNFIRSDLNPRQCRRF